MGPPPTAREKAWRPLTGAALAHTQPLAEGMGTPRAVTVPRPTQSHCWLRSQTPPWKHHLELCRVKFSFTENAVWTLRTAIWRYLSVRVGLKKALKCADGPSTSFWVDMGVDALETLRSTSNEWNEEGTASGRPGAPGEQGGSSRPAGAVGGSRGRGQEQLAQGRVLDKWSWWLAGRTAPQALSPDGALRRKHWGLQDG